jgi:hypothetical protein
MMPVEVVIVVIRPCASMAVMRRESIGMAGRRISAYVMDGGTVNPFQYRTEHDISILPKPSTRVLGPAKFFVTIVYPYTPCNYPRICDVALHIGIDP